MRMPIMVVLVTVMITTEISDMATLGTLAPDTQEILDLDMHLDTVLELVTLVPSQWHILQWDTNLII